MSDRSPTDSLPLTCCLVALSLVGWACWRTANPPPTLQTLSVQRLESVALPNLHRLTSGIYSGGSPKGDASLAELAALGVKTVISVDGEAPPAEAAAKLGIRYVHLPIGYTGVPRERVVELLSAFRSLPGPVYIHCHRGLHRGPAAAVALCRLVADLDAPAAEKLLEDLGTARKYPGLYASVENLSPVTAYDLRQHPADRLPSVAEVPPLAAQMVEIEAHWEHLSMKLGAATEWDDALKADYVIFEEQLLEGIRTPAPPSVDFLNVWWGTGWYKVIWFTPSRTPKQTRQVVNETCNDCHQRFRDVPQ
jgi:hypothetical protein